MTNIQPDFCCLISILCTVSKSTKMDRGNTNESNYQQVTTSALLYDPLNNVIRRKLLDGNRRKSTMKPIKERGSIFQKIFKLIQYVLRKVCSILQLFLGVNQPLNSKY